jgi:hypothetical protein
MPRRGYRIQPRGFDPISANLSDLRLTKMPGTPDTEDEFEFEDEDD